MLGFAPSRSRSREISLGRSASPGLAAARLGVPALTSDGAWADADVEAEVVLIR